MKSSWVPLGHLLSRSLTQAALNTKYLHEFKGRTNEKKIVIKYTGLNTWSNKYITKDTENTSSTTTKMVGEYLGEIPHMFALRRCLVTQPRPLPEVITGDGAPCTFGLTQDIHPYIVRNIFSRPERTATLPHRDEVREIRPHGKSVGKLDYKRPAQSLPKISFLSPSSTQNGFRERRVSRNTPPSGGTKILNASEPSIALRAIPLQFVRSKVFTGSPTSLHTSCCCSFRQLVTCLLSKHYLLLTCSQGDSIKKSEKQPHCSQGSKEFLLRYSLPCVLLSCM